MHRRRGLHQWLSGKESACNAGVERDACSVPASGRSPGGGHGNPLQYSYLEHHMDRGAWWGYSPQGHKELDTTETTQHALIGVEFGTKNTLQLKNLYSGHSCIHSLHLKKNKTKNGGSFLPVLRVGYVEMLKRCWGDPSVIDEMGKSGHSAVSAMRKVHSSTGIQIKGVITSFLSHCVRK